MSANFQLGPAWIFTSDNITDPLSSWTKLAMTRDGVTVRTSSGFLSMARSDQNGLTPLAESVRKVGSQLEGAETKFLNNDIDEILRAIPGGVKITDTTKEAIGFGQVTATLSPKAFAVVPVDDYNEDTPGSWYDSDNVWYFENALMEITGETSFALREGEDNLEGYTVDIKPFANATAGAYMGGRGLYRTFIYQNLAVGDRPRGIAVTSDQSKLIVCNYNDGNVTIIDLSDNSTAVVTTGTNPNTVVIAPDDSIAIVSNRGSNNVTKIDLSDNSTTNVAVGTNPTGVAITPDGTLCVVCNYASDTVTRIDLSDDSTTTVVVGDQPERVAITSDSATAIVTNNGDDNVTKITLSDNTKSNVNVGVDPVGIAIAPDDSVAVVCNSFDDTVTIIDLSDDSTTTVTVGDSPFGVAITPDSSVAIVCNISDDTVTIIDLSDESTTTETVGDQPFGVAISPDGLVAYITNQNDDTVTFLVSIFNA